MIPEEENEFDEISSQQPSPKSPRKFENKSSSRSPSPAAQETTASMTSASSTQQPPSPKSPRKFENKSLAAAVPMTSEIDKLCKLVHELKEEDLNNYRRKIAEQKASAASKIKEERFSSSPETEVSPLPPSAPLELPKGI